ncbi:MAG: hypothetical protein HC840_00295 [Leptolyngbyaceae cyanobacterium RM2_2_4]|nr:hypothetical protein [Leptolyngbyaceae cyanobacterium RM2_2_4]
MVDKIINGMPAKEYYRQNYLKNRDKKLKMSREYRIKNRDKCLEYLNEWSKKNKDKKIDLDAKWRKENAEYKKEKRRKEYWDNREENIAKSLKWQKDNPGKVKAKNMKRLADINKSTPKCADLKKIQEIYENCPPGYEVDHIIPLRGKNVSGLHIETNLQYLTKADNCKKSNKYELSQSY